MGKEIERKFLVAKEFIKTLGIGEKIVQGYLPSANKTVVRIRTTDDKAFLTIKGENRGAVRSEFEYAIPQSDADQIIGELCERPFIEKTRHIVMHSESRWEIDVFEGDNAGLAIAEIELESENQNFDVPSWAIVEVTDDPKYYNSNLIKKPYKEWDKSWLR